MITKDDVVIGISNSGNTAELITIIPLIKRLGIPMISMTGDPKSQLAKAAYANLDVSVASEACPLNLAPTTSTTVTLVMGDALAIALLESRGFSAEDFAFSHPGGALGRKLLLKVSDIMHQGDELPRVLPSMPLQNALLEMTEKGFGMTTVTDADGKLIGVFTDGDLRRVLDTNVDLNSVTIEEVMSNSPKPYQATCWQQRLYQLWKNRVSLRLLLQMTVNTLKGGTYARYHPCRGGLIMTEYSSALLDAAKNKVASSRCGWGLN